MEGFARIILDDYAPALDEEGRRYQADAPEDRDGLAAAIV